METNRRKKAEERGKKPVGPAYMSDLPVKPLTAEQEKDVKAGLLVVIAAQQKADGTKAT